MRYLASRLVVVLATLVLVAWTVEPVFAQSRSRDSSRSSRDRSSRSAVDDDDFDDDEDFEDDDSGSRRSRSRSSARDSRSSSRSSSSRRRSSSSRGGSGDYTPPAIVFGENYERSGVRPRGNIHSVEAFEALPCTATAVEAAGTTFYRCDDAWYNRVEHEGWVCYSEVFPPAGLTISTLPSGATPLHAAGKTLYATADAFYEKKTETGTTRYAVVEPQVGWVFERLPEAATRGIPVRSGRHDYYRHLGVFYREEKIGAETRYVVSTSPFVPPGVPVASATPTATPAP